MIDPITPEPKSMKSLKDRIEQDIEKLHMKRREMYKQFKTHYKIIMNLDKDLTEIKDQLSELRENLKMITTETPKPFKPKMEPRKKLKYETKRKSRKTST